MCGGKKYVHTKYFYHYLFFMFLVAHNRLRSYSREFLILLLTMSYPCPYMMSVFSLKKKLIQNEPLIQGVKKFITFGHPEGHLVPRCRSWSFSSSSKSGGKLSRRLRHCRWRCRQKLIRFW